MNDQTEQFEWERSLHQKIEKRLVWKEISIVLFIALMAWYREYFLHGFF